MTKFKDRYTKVGAQGSFGGIQATGHTFGKTPRASEKALIKIPTYLAHRQHKPVKNFIPIFTYFPREIMSIDLLQIEPDLIPFNDGVKYLFVLVDNFTRFVWVKTLMDKKSSSTAKAFRELLDIVGFSRNVSKLILDRGSEWRGAFKELCDERNIKLYFDTALSHSSMAENAIKLLKRLIYQLIYHTQNNRFLEDLPGIVRTMNKRLLRRTNYTLSPYMCEFPQNYSLIRLFNEKDWSKRNLFSVKFQKRKAEILKKYPVGTVVRISKTPGTIFRKTYKPELISPLEQYKVQNIDTKFPIALLTLEDLLGNTILGKFYSRQVKPSLSDEYWIEKILKRRRRNGRLEYLVKYRGYSHMHNSWVPAEDLKPIGRT